MRLIVAIASVAALLAGCGGSSHKRETASRGRRAVAAYDAQRAARASCGTTALRTGPVPSWTDSAWATGSPPPLPYAVAARGTAAGFLFGFPLRARRQTDKILWIVRLPRNNSRLVIRARPLAAARPVVTVTQPPDSSPGEIYPSIVNVPRPGCWRLTLSWAGHTDTIDLHYQA